MREHRNVIAFAVATANGFAMPYRTRKPVQPDESAAPEPDLTTEIMRRPSLEGVLRTLARGRSETKS